MDYNNLGLSEKTQTLLQSIHRRIKNSNLKTIYEELVLSIADDCSKQLELFESLKLESLDAKFQKVSIVFFKYRNKFEFLSF